MLKEWSDEYSIGIGDIDEQHKGFFRATHRLYDHILNCEGEKAVEETLEFLRDYAMRHFQDEEAFMRKYGFPGLERHRQLHVEFVEALEMLLDDLKVAGPSQDLADRALEISQDWLIDHIVDEDTQYATYIQKQQHG